jgi:molybdopterin-guanine dinucleotide biosynthesis protein A
VTGGPSSCFGVLVAGGPGRRMGADKAHLPFRGEPLAARCARLLSEVCDQVIVASGDGRRLAWLGLPQVADVMPGRGPLGGLVAGLEASGRPMVAALAADMPFASPALFRLLAGLLGDQDAAVPVTERGPEPLHAVYAAAAAGTLRVELEAGRLALHQALDVLRVRWVDREGWEPVDPNGRFAVNLNRPEDFVRFDTLWP